MIVDDSPVMRAFVRKVVGLAGLDGGEYCGESFDLKSPKLLPVGSAAAVGSEPLPATTESFEIENGILTLTLHLKATA